MAQSSESNLPRPPLLPRLTEATMLGAMAPYEAALERMSSSQLTQELTRINALMQQQAQSTTESLLRAKLEQESQPHASSTRTPDPSPDQDRGRPTTRSPQPSPLDLLAASSRMGPRLAARLTLASARAQARRNER